MSRQYRTSVLFTSISLLFSTLANSQTLHRLPLYGEGAVFQAQTTPPAPGQTAQPSKLNINVIEGAGAVNNVKTRAAREFTVEVDDENDHPVAGAMVTFFAPSEGPGGSFAGDTQLLSVMTDKNGRAVATSFRPNGTVGDYKIEVTATYVDQTATTFISQSNQSPAGAVAAKPHSGKKVALIVAAVAAVGAGAGLGLMHGGSSSSSSSSTTQTATLGVGNPTVGAPH